MKTISKAANTRLFNVAGRLDSTADDLETAIDAYNATMDAQRQLVEDALNAYNDAARDAEEIREEVHAEMEDYFDGRTEKWQESEKGLEFADWKDAWGEQIDEADIDFPTTLETPQMTLGSDLLDLPRDW